MNAVETSLTRRRLLELLSGGVLGSLAGWPRRAFAGSFRIRTVTAGVRLQSVADLAGLDAAFDFLATAQQRFVDSGYELQTVRVATQPLAEFLPEWMKPAAIEPLRRLDQHAADGGASFSIGPVLTRDEASPDLAPWAADLVAATGNTSFTAFAASAQSGIHYHAAQSVAEAMRAIASATSGGEGNFRFAATALCPPGTPFFPAAYHTGAPAFSIGLESPGLLQAAIEQAVDIPDAKTRMTVQMNTALRPVEDLAQALASATGWRFLGIDASPAPGLDASIGRAIETLSGAPFGAPSTLAACAAITDVLRSLEVETCGYSGLMLPVLEDTVLAQRAAEGRYGVSDLLLYSSVCGTGLDVVPLPGDVSADKLAALVIDMAALAVKYRKPLSARLFPVPGKVAGDTVTFDNPHLTDATVMAPDR